MSILPSKSTSSTPAVPEKEMSFLDHLEELRWHIIRSIGAVVVIGIIVFSQREIVTSVLFGPRTASFPTYQFIGSYFDTHTVIYSIFVATNTVVTPFPGSIGT